MEEAMSRYNWVTTEMFEQALEDLVCETMTVGELLGYSGVRDVLQEELNNEVLERLEERREEYDPGYKPSEEEDDD